MAEIDETFHIDAAMVEAFAGLTGYRNALHMDAAFARRSRYRERVAHGMLAVARLARLQRQFPDRALRFRRLEGRFAAPIPLGTDLRLRVTLGPESDGERPFEAEWTALPGGQRIMTASGSVALLPASEGKRPR